MALDIKEITVATLKRDKPITYLDFLAQTDEDISAEWVDGDVEFMSPVSHAHQDLAGFIAAIMRLFAEDHDMGRVLTAPFQMHLASAKRGREPDIIFVARQHLERLQRNHLEGPADLAIEIISPESRLRDRGDKYAEYEASGVREYWILDPEQKRADFFVLGGDARYKSMPPNAAGIYSSQVLNEFRLNINWLWQEPLPTLRSVLKAWEGTE
jgi:Uma2 family endonuclease